MTTKAIDILRAEFEDAAFKQRYISSIQKLTPPHAGFSLQSVDCSTMEEFTRRDSNGDYVESGLEAAWWGWQAAHKYMTSDGEVITASIMTQEKDDGSPAYCLMVAYRSLEPAKRLLAALTL